MRSALLLLLKHLRQHPQLVLNRRTRRGRAFPVQSLQPLHTGYNIFSGISCSVRCRRGLGSLVLLRQRVLLLLFSLLAGRHSGELLKHGNMSYWFMWSLQQMSSCRHALPKRWLALATAKTRGQRLPLMSCVCMFAAQASERTGRGCFRRMIWSWRESGLGSMILAHLPASRRERGMSVIGQSASKPRKRLCFLRAAELLLAPTLAAGLLSLLLLHLHSSSPQRHHTCFSDGARGRRWRAISARWAEIVLSAWHLMRAEWSTPVFLSS